MKKQLQLIINCPNGEKLYKMFPKQATGYDVALSVAAMTGIPPSCQRLRTSRKTLLLNRTLSDQELTSDETLTCHILLKGGSGMVNWHNYIHYSQVVLNSQLTYVYTGSVLVQIIIYKVIIDAV